MQLVVDRFNEALAEEGPDAVGIYNSGQLLLEEYTRSERSHPPVLKPHFPTAWQVSESYEKDLETGHEHTIDEYRKKRDPRGRAVPGEFPPDLASQMDRWPRERREAKVLQHAISRLSKLNAIGRMLYPLAGLEPELPVSAVERAVIVPAMTPTPHPAAAERTGAIAIEAAEGPEGEYVRQLFSVRQVWGSW